MIDPWLPVIMLPLGACAGSFLGVLVHRLPRGQSPSHGRSCCESCGAVLQARDLIPLVSFAQLKGRCRHCGTPIRRELPAIELAAAAIGVLASILMPTVALAAAAALLGWALLALAWIDARHFTLPDEITLPLIPAGLAASWWMMPDAALDHAIGAAAGYLGLRAVNAAYKRLRHRDGIGEGDAKLLALAGAWLGWRPLPWVLAAAAMTGILLALAQIGFKRQRLSATLRVPFGTCLAPAIFSSYLAMNLPFF